MFGLQNPKIKLHFVYAINHKIMKNVGNVLLPPPALVRLEREENECGFKLIEMEDFRRNLGTPMG